MKSITKALRANTALQVIQRMNAGMSVSAACRAAGMPRSSFYYFLENNPQAVTEIQAMIDANNREQLGLILLSKTEILRKVIEAGLADSTRPQDRLAIFEKLGELEAAMTKGLGVENENEKQARAFLEEGPRLVQAKSRFTAIETTVTIEGER